MKKTTLFAVLFLLVNVFAGAQSAEDLIAKHLEAIGASNWSKAEAIKMEATITAEAAPGMTIGYTMTTVRDKAMRMDVSVMGMVQSSAVKGESGWANNPFAGQTDPEPLTEDQVKAMMEQTDIDGTLVGYKEKGYTVEYIGTEEVEGVEAHKIKIDKGNKKVEYSLLDPESFLEIKNIQVAEVDGQEVTTETVYSNFREQDGIKFPYTMQQANPTMGNSTITVTGITINPTVDMKIFDMPEK